MEQSSTKCPYCGSSDVARAHRRFYEKFFIGWKAFRCHTCLRRFLDRTGQA